MATLVALLAEGVDRNTHAYTSLTNFPVALLAEGVDRNYAALISQHGKLGRPPRGGRG